MHADGSSAYFLGTQEENSQDPVNTSIKLFRDVLFCNGVHSICMAQTILRSLQRKVSTQSIHVCTHLSTWPMVCFFILSTCLCRASSLIASNARVTLAARRLSFRSRVRKKLRKFSRSMRPSPFASNLVGGGGRFHQ